MNKKNYLLKELLVYLVILLILYLFYKSVWIITLLLPCIIIYRRVRKKELVIKRKSILSTQFKDMLDSLAASLRAGYATPNAIFECLKEMRIMHGEDSPIYQELLVMKNQLEMGVPAEDAINSFAERNKVEDIETFATVYNIALVSGGDMVEIVKKSADDIGSKIDTRSEIDVLISSRKLEMNIMSMIPVGIILYMDFTTDGLLDPLYGNPAGVVIMTVCLAIYIAAMIIGRKMSNIEV